MTGTETAIPLVSPGQGSSIKCQVLLTLGTYNSQSPSYFSLLKPTAYLTATLGQPRCPQVTGQSTSPTQAEESYTSVDVSITHTRGE
jgi:hypothetical protein